MLYDNTLEISGLIPLWSSCICTGEGGGVLAVPLSHHTQLLLVVLRGMAPCNQNPAYCSEHN